MTREPPHCYGNSSPRGWRTNNEYRRCFPSDGWYEKSMDL